jgi:hypothetical protein
MYGLVKFWYCISHEDGHATLHYDNDFSEEQPEWLDICRCEPKCIYECHGIIEINASGEMIIHKPVVSNYVYIKRLFSSFQREYYELVFQENDGFYSIDEISTELYNYLRNN